MDNSSYATLTRQVGLLREMQALAHNLANMSTTGFRREGVVFTEFIRDTEPGHHSLSMAAARAGVTSSVQGTLSQTGSPFDLAIEGEGYFLVATPEGNMLTRAGAFLASPEGALVTPDGMTLLDGGGAPIVLPGSTRDLAVASDGTMSADGVPIAQIGLWQPADESDLERRAGVRFLTSAAPIPAPEDAGRIVQGFLESSNVDPVSEVTRMIEVQRAYELGQRFLDREDERIRSVLRSASR